jgi:uncharacterized protein YjbJ (UPF0337 family)
MGKEDPDMRERDRERCIADSAEKNAREAVDTMTDEERLEAESKGRRTASDVKTSGEKLKDVHRR